MKAFLFLGTLAFAALVLAGCITPAQRAQQQQASDDAQCVSMGAERGSDRYYQCRMELSRVHAANDQFRAEQRSGAYDDMMNMGMTLMRGP